MMSKSGPLELINLLIWNDGPAVTSPRAVASHTLFPTENAILTCRRRTSQTQKQTISFLYCLFPADGFSESIWSPRDPRAFTFRQHFVLLTMMGGQSDGRCVDKNICLIYSAN